LLIKSHLFILPGDTVILTSSVRTDSDLSLDQPAKSARGSHLHRNNSGKNSCGENSHPASEPQQQQLHHNTTAAATTAAASGSSFVLLRSSSSSQHSVCTTSKVLDQNRTNMPLGKGKDKDKDKSEFDCEYCLTFVSVCCGRFCCFFLFILLDSKY
jgi:hypothetical protein